MYSVGKDTEKLNSFTRDSVEQYKASTRREIRTPGLGS